MPALVSDADARVAAPAHSFLPHVQGLRAVAVLAVVVFHVWPGALPGGFAGVDVFFVISGLLITSHLAREIETTGTVRLAAFWARRARRLLPAALVVLAFCAVVIATPWFVPVSEAPSRLKEIVASIFYVENWYLVATSANYLGHSGDPSLSQHYWSLSVEEQFYVVWPLLLIGAVVLARRVARARGRMLIVTVGLTTALSFVGCVWFTAVSPAAAYFTTFTRVWEFGVGALLALLPALRVRSLILRVVLGWVGLGVLFASFYLLNGALRFPGYLALVPVIATAMVIMAGPERRPWAATAVITLPPFSFLGSVSYSLYLWHWPLLLTAPSLPFWTGDLSQRLLLLVVCVGMAWATRRWVEEPMRALPVLVHRPAGRTLWLTAAAMAVAVVVTAGAGLAVLPRYQQARAEISAAHAAPAPCSAAAAIKDPACASARFDSFTPSPAAAGMDGPSDRTCLVSYDESEARPCSFGSADAAAPEIILIGDSHAFQYVDVLANIAEKRGWRLTALLKGGCPWSSTPLADDGPFGRACSVWRAEVDGILATKAPALVVTSAFGGTSYAVEGHPSEADAAEQGFRSAWAPLVARGIPLLAIADNPSVQANPNVCLLNRPVAACLVDRRAALPAVDAFVAAAAGSETVHIVDFSDVYCDDQTCSPVVGGVDVYRDPDHLTATFAASLEPWLAEAADAAVAAGR